MKLNQLTELWLKSLDLGFDSSYNEYNYKQTVHISHCIENIHWSIEVSFAGSDLYDWSFIRVIYLGESRHMECFSLSDAESVMPTDLFQLIAQFYRKK